MYNRIFPEELHCPVDSRQKKGEFCRVGESIYLHPENERSYRLQNHLQEEKNTSTNKTSQRNMDNYTVDGSIISFETSQIV